MREERRFIEGWGGTVYATKYVVLRFQYDTLQIDLTLSSRESAIRNLHVFEHPGEMLLVVARP